MQSRWWRRGLFNRKYSIAWVWWKELASWCYYKSCFVLLCLKIKFIFWRQKWTKCSDWFRDYFVRFWVYVCLFVSHSITISSWGIVLDFIHVCWLKRQGAPPEMVLIRSSVPSNMVMVKYHKLLFNINLSWEFEFAIRHGRTYEFTYLQDTYLKYGQLTSHQSHR